MKPKTQEQEVQSPGSWMQPIQEKLASLCERSLNLSIFKVPYELRKADEDVYSPGIVSIGPFHSTTTTTSSLQQTSANKLVAEDDDKWGHMLSLLQQTLVKKNDHLQAMEEHKWWYTLYFIHRTPKEKDPREILNECGTAIFYLDKKVRGIYAANIKHKRHELAEIMLIDGCFILELLMRSWWPCKEEDGDYIFHNTWMVPTLQQDLALLENQIPFCILENLYEIIVRHLHTPENGVPMPSIAELALHFFHPEVKSNQELAEKCSKAGKDCKHLLDLLHNFYLPAPPTPKTNPEGNEDKAGKDCKHLLDLLHNLKLKQEAITEKCSTCLKIDPEDKAGLESNQEAKKVKGQESWGFKKGVTSLSEAGTVFEKVTTDHLLGIEYDEGKGIIKIPPLSIDGKTESLLRNLIAFEQCSRGNKYHVSSYVILLNSLIRSSQDIELLKKKKIIITPNWVGDENVLNFFNDISRKIKAEDFCFGDLCDKVEADEKSWWHWNRIKAFCMVRSLTYWKVLKRDYFSTPWSFISFIAALVLLVLTIVQTYYSARSYLHPH